MCTTELGYMAKLKPEFDKRERQDHRFRALTRSTSMRAGPNDIEGDAGHAPNYPMIGDTDLEIRQGLGHAAGRTQRPGEGRTAADNQTVRNVFVIGPDKKVKLIIVYPMTTGRNFDEVLRVIDSLQLTAKHKVSTPVNWKHGEDVIIAGSVFDDDAKKV